MHTPRNGLDSLLTLATFAALMVALVVGLGPNVSTQLVGVGESIWPNYAADLRADPERPTCDLGLIAEQEKTCTSAPKAADPFGGKDPFGGDDPFAEPSPRPKVDDPFEGKDPFAEPTPKPTADDPFEGKDPFAKPAPKPTADDPFGGADPFTATEPASAVSCAALQNLEARCTTRWAHFDDIQSRMTPGVQSFRSAELRISGLAKFPFWKHLLVALVLLGGLATSLRDSHIALRVPRSALGHRVAHGAQLLAHLVWLASSVADWRVQNASAAEAESPELPLLWATGFTLLAAVHLWHLIRVPADRSETAAPLNLLMVVPLYTWMALIAAAWFLIAEGHPSGQAIFLHKFIQIPDIYVGIGLYIWAGMLLARTRVAPLVFDVLLPWRLPPTLLAWLVVVLAALPTAYSGASGIFVIAAGAVIFERLRAAGASPRIALAATAMSGSLGVVLRPCLVVVLVSVLNENATTGPLFAWGRAVFALTALLFLIAMLWRNDQPLKLPPIGEALSGSGRALLPLLPYIGLGVVVVAVYAVLLGTPVNEQTAMYVLPGMMLVLTAFDRLRNRDEADAQGLVPALTHATSESSHHVGALLFVMAGSVGIGGVVERAELLAYLPAEFGSRITAMAFLVVVMVLVGMTMDALGAVILVSVTLAHVAEANGIHPIHFWMMVLCAFELGYLTPPVALNHLLARQVIGPDADVHLLPAEHWFERHEHILLPMAVMGTALLIVAFVPLAFV